MTAAESPGIGLGRVARRPAVVARRLVGWPFNGSDGRPDTTGSPPYVCPFCGRGYETARRRCRACDGLPVVDRDDRSVYGAVLAPCGPRCSP